MFRSMARMNERQQFRLSHNMHWNVLHFGKCLDCGGNAFGFGWQNCQYSDLKAARLDHLSKSGQPAMQRNVVPHRLHNAIPATAVASIDTRQADTSGLRRFEVICPRHTRPVQRGKSAAQFIRPLLACKMSI